MSKKAGSCGGSWRRMKEEKTAWTTWYFASHGMAAALQRHLAFLKEEPRGHLEEHGGGLEGEAGWNQKLARDEDCGEDHTYFQERRRCS